MKNTLTAILWVLVYLLLGLAPLFIVTAAHPPAGRPFVVELSVALGVVGLSMTGLQFALIGRFKPAAAPFRIDALTTFHKQVSFIALTSDNATVASPGNRHQPAHLRPTQALPAEVGIQPSRHRLLARRAHRGDGGGVPARRAGSHPWG